MCQELNWTYHFEWNTLFSGQGRAGYKAWKQMRLLLGYWRRVFSHEIVLTFLTKTILYTPDHKHILEALPILKIAEIVRNN